MMRRAVAGCVCALAATLAACGASKPPAAAVNSSQLSTAQLGAEAGEWRSVGGGWRGTHFSQLADINRDTVAQLGLAWEFATGTHRGLEATPVVIDGMLYASGVAGRVYALDAATGEERWRFEPSVDLQVVRGTCCDEVNRGVAVSQGRVYVAALDGWLYALDARDGHVVWKTDSFADRSRAYSSTGAPVVAGDVVVIGNAGGEYDARGYVSAYELADGALRWRFYTVPGATPMPGENSELEAARKTWDPRSDWRYGGGGPAWDGLAYDPELDLLYVGTGNAETYSQHVRSPSGGDNLYTCSVLALSPKTGRLAWFYQETPGDQWDFDSTAPMILVDREIDGVPRHLLLHAPKNGLFYVLDRADGKLVSAEKFVNANWTTGVDKATGRPVIDRAAADYRDHAKLVFPSVVGAHSWQPMAFSPQTGLVYIPTTHVGTLLFDESGQTDYRPTLFNSNVGLVFSGMLDFLKDSLPPHIQQDLRGLLPADLGQLKMSAYLQAWDPIAQREVWHTAEGDWWDHAGVLASAGGLVFQGSDRGVLRVFDAASGALLRSIDTGTPIIAAPAMYRVAGVSYVTVLAGWGGGGWAVPHPESAAFQRGNANRILAFKLGGTDVPLPPLLPPDPPLPPPPRQRVNAAILAKGGALFGANCAICHPNQPRTGSADLRRMSPGIHGAFDQIVLDGVKRDAGMPGWGDVLSRDDADAIHAFLIDQSRQAYAAQKKGAGSNAGTGIIKGY